MTHTPSFKQFFGRALMVSGVALLCFSSPAQAGFEWRGPLEPPVRQAAPAPVQNDMSGLAPVTAWDGSAAPAPAAPAAPVAAVDAEPVSPALAPFTPATAAPAPAAAPTDVVAGFGRDLPLVIALQQVAPAGHQFSFAPGVNPGVMVSWEGGKPWQQVMNDMLAPQGLGYQLQGNVVVIGFFNTDAAVLPPGAADGMSVMPSDEASAAPAGAPTSLTAAPAAETAPVVAAEAAPAEAAAAEAVTSHGEPVTIRRSRPASESRTAGAQTESVSVMAAPGGKEPVMSYPPETAGTRPVAVTSLPPAATQSPVSEAPADLAVPPPMEAMSPAPEAAAEAAPAAEAAKVEAAKVEAAVEAAPAAAVAAPTSLVAPAEQSTAAPQKAGAPWAGAKGATLRDTLKSWSDAASVELFWSIDYDYKLKNDISYAGSYDEAVGKLLDQFASVRPQPYGQLHKGKDGPSVLVVKSYDLTP